MKSLTAVTLAFSLLLLVITGCKKDKTAPAAITLQQLVSRVIGYYTVTQICDQNNGSGVFIADTAYNVSLVISTANDTTIIMDGATLSFSGNLATPPYTFYCPASGGGYNAQFDSTFHNIQFGVSANGLGGGGCGGSGSK